MNYFVAGNDYYSTTSLTVTIIPIFQCPRYHKTVNDLQLQTIGSHPWLNFTK